jgi:hypothetical protein
LTPSADAYAIVSKPSRITHFEQVNLSPTKPPDPSFAVRWTCLLLLAIQRILRSNRLWMLGNKVEEILRKNERHISDLERIKVEADGMEDVDWRISLGQYKWMKLLTG